MWKRFTDSFASNKDKDAVKTTTTTTTTLTKKPVRPVSTKKAVTDLMKTHPIHVAVLDGNSRYSYLLKDGAGAQDIFGTVGDGKTPTVTDDDYDYMNDDSDFDSKRASDGDITEAVNEKSGRGTLKAFTKTTTRGGRGGLRTIYNELSGKANAVVIRRPDEEYYYGNLTHFLRMNESVPIMVVSSYTEKAVRELVAKELVQPAQFKYVYGEELKKLSASEKKNYDAAAAEYQKVSDKYYRAKALKDFWSPLISKIDAWAKAGEVVNIVFVNPNNLEKGLNTFQTYLEHQYPSQHDSKKQQNDQQQQQQLPNIIKEMLLSA